MSVKQTIYNRLRADGLTHAGALGMMGNWQCESDLEAYRLQGDFSPFRTQSHDYTQKVMNGTISKEIFCGDSKGYGLAQWTLSSRKRKLFEAWKAAKKELDDPEFQTGFALQELKTEGEFAGLYKLLKTSDNLYNNTAAVCRQYERPAINNIDARYAAAQQIEQSIKDTGSYGEPTPEPAENNGVQLLPTHEFWPPRVLCRGMKGSDVEVMTALLKAREAGIHYVTPEFGNFVESKVLLFQEANGLKTDGIVGPLTWAALLKQ